MASFVIHIGDGKCGSSSIQASLYGARDMLRSAGIVFETATPGSGQFSLAMLLGLQDRGNQEKSLEQARCTLEMIQKVRRPDDTILLSAESFFSVQPMRLMDLLQTHFGTVDHVRIVAYVREPHDMYLSLMQQQLKGDSRIVPPERYVRDIPAILTAWETCPAVDNLTVRLFSRAQLIEGDVVADFEHVLRGLTDRHDIRLPRKNENTTMSAEQMIVLQDYRKRFLKDHDGKLHPESNAVVRYFETLGKLGFPGTKPALDAAALAKVRHANRQIAVAMQAFLPGIELQGPVGIDENRLTRPFAKSMGTAEVGATVRGPAGLRRMTRAAGVSFLGACLRLMPFLRSGRRPEEDAENVRSILGHWDPRIVPLLQLLVFDQSTEKAKMAGSIEKLLRYCDQVGLDPAPFVAETIRFRKQIASIRAAPSSVSGGTLAAKLG